MVNGSDCLQIRGRGGLQLIKGRIQEYVVSCGMIAHHFNMLGIVDRIIDCSKCKQQYVGETELEFHCRMNNHKSDIRLENKSNGMVRHFSKCGIDNVTPNILEKVRSRDHYIRKAREQYYIELLEPQINAQ